MGFQGTATAGGGDVYLPPPGNHPARMVAALNLGWFDDPYRNPKTQTERRSWRQRCLFGWQLTGADPTGVVFKDFYLAFSPRAGLRMLMEKLRGKPYQEGDNIDPLKMLDQPCLVSILHQMSNSGATFVKIDGFSQVPAGLAVPPATFDRLVWEIGNGPWPNVPWLPTHLYGEKIADLLARAKTEPPTAPAGANRTSPTSAAVTTNGAVPSNTPTAAAPPIPPDVSF
jgi:hypothetical protein